MVPSVTLYMCISPWGRRRRKMQRIKLRMGIFNLPRPGSLSHDGSCSVMAGMSRPAPSACDAAHGWCRDFFAQRRERLSTKYLSPSLGCTYLINPKLPGPITPISYTHEQFTERFMSPYISLPAWQLPRRVLGLCNTRPCQGRSRRYIYLDLTVISKYQTY